MAPSRTSKPWKMQACEPMFRCRIGKSAMRSGRPPTSEMSRRLISIAVRKARCCNRWGRSIPTDVSSIVLLLPSAMPAQSKCSGTTSTQGRRVYRHVGEEYVERVRTYQQTPTYQKALRKRQVWVKPLFAEARVLAWSAPLPPAAARAASIVKPYALLLGKISSACSRNGDGDGVRSQSRPSRPSFWLVTGGLFILRWDLCLLLHVFAHLPS